MSKNNKTNGKEPVKFGTFGGVFTPSILTTFGVIMFMRANYVVGEAGIINAALILFISQFITLLTTLSIGAISTNMSVKGGGAYYIVSRVLGAELGGAIGIALFAAQVISISFYLLGFTEAVTVAFPSTAQYFMYIGLISATVLFLIAYTGADWAMKTQYIIMAVLSSSILIYLFGAGRHFDTAQFTANLKAPENGTSFWTLFAIYFPSVTGFIAGINMSGDLKDPGKNMLRGTLYSLVVATSVYFIQTLIFGGAIGRDNLIAKPFEIMIDNALFGAGFMVIAGVYAATLSSALGRFVGAPRVLQAIARDEILPYIKPFARGFGHSDEPRNGLYLCYGVTLIMLVMGGNGSGGQFLNTVASVMGMFFLYTFGLLNLAAFIELYSSNPSYRPKFRFFHWSVALFGVILSFGSAILIDAKSAIAAFLLLYLLIWYLRKRQMTTSFGDARRGYLYTKIRKNLFNLQYLPEDTRNWRPSIAVLTGNPNTRSTLATYANWFNSNKGIIILSNILIGDQELFASQRITAIKQMHNFLLEKNIKAFPHVIIADSVINGTKILLRGTAYSPLRPNILACGWKNDTVNGADDYLATLKEATTLNINQVLISEGAKQLTKKKNKRIDLWWRGRKNGSLMLLLAHLLIHNWEWAGATVVVKRVIENDAGHDPALDALEKLIFDSRVEAEAEVVISNTPFDETLHQHSKDADCVFLGFELPEEEYAEAWFKAYNRMLKDMPPTMLIHSTDEQDYLNPEE